MASSTPPPLLSIRTSLILLVALVFGTVTGGLTVVAGVHIALAVLVGLGTTGSTILGLHKLIDF